ncbi:hypothetical protein [Pedobacter gandavensis]|uniref:hypothetical protein n=1 Tax=Pedobacter gandavensis TaxID=2679963 RepID=UPI00292FFCF6|nr:hypothetical protein [Pedobacter gandavensis]
MIFFEKLFSRSKIEKWELALMSNVLIKLPEKYSCLTTQIRDGLFRGVLLGVSDIPNYVAFTFNSEVLKKYDKVDDVDYKLTNIKVYDNKMSNFLPYEIYLSSGTISGYSLGGGKKHDLDLSKIDVVEFKMEILNGSDYERILTILNTYEQHLLNPSNVYSVFVDNNEYFHIGDSEDGDFFCIDINKNVYKITHDPLEVIALNMQLIDFFTNKNNGHES